PFVAGSAGVAGPAPVVGPASVAGPAPVAGSAGVVGSAVVVGSAFVAGPAGLACARLRPGLASGSGQGDASSEWSRHSGTPSVRQRISICQRGSSSPGYHLPWPKCSNPFGANRSASFLLSL